MSDFIDTSSQVNLFSLHLKMVYLNKNGDPKESVPYF